MRTLAVTAAAIVAGALACGGAVWAATASVGTPAAGSRVVPATPDRAPPMAGIVFEENCGQTAAGVSFLVRRPAFTAFFAPSEVTFALDGGESAQMAFRGTSDSARIEGHGLTGGISTYLRGTGSSDVVGARHFATAHTRDLYPGIDLRWRGDARRRLTYDLCLAPGTDPTRIEFEVVGAADVRIDADGTLHVATPGGEFEHGRPFIFQETRGVRTAVAGGFVLRGEHRVGFEVGNYDRTAPLVIDPTIEYTSFFGGESDDRATDIAIDATGAAYITGQTESREFPVGDDPGSVFSGGRNDVFVTKVGPDGMSIAYSLYLGGSGQESGDGIAVNSVGEAFVCGFAPSPEFPIVAPLPGTSESTAGAFITKVAADGRSLLFSTRISTSIGGRAKAIALDSEGNAYVAGEAGGAFPASAGAFQETEGGRGDAFVLKLSADGSAIVYATYLGGAESDFPFDIAVDADGHAYALGATFSDDFPATAALSPRSEHERDGWLAKLDPDGSALRYSVTFASSDPRAVVVDAAGAAYVTGNKSSPDFPITHVPNGVRENYPRAAYVLKLSAVGALEFSTIVGGRGPRGVDDFKVGVFSTDIARDAAGGIYVCGGGDGRDGRYRTRSSTRDHGPNAGPFVTRLTPDGREVTYASFVPGVDVTSIAVGPDGTAWLTGGQSRSTRTETIEPIPGAVAETDANQRNVLVVRLAPQNTRMVIVNGDAWDGRRGLDRIRFRCKHWFRKTGEPFNPSKHDVVVTVASGQQTRTLTIPANHGRWRRKGGNGWRWDSASGSPRQWRIGFGARSSVSVQVKGAVFRDPMAKTFSVNITVAGDTAFALRKWRRVRNGPPRRFQMR